MYGIKILVWKRVDNKKYVTLTYGSKGLKDGNSPIRELKFALLYTNIQSDKDMCTCTYYFPFENKFSVGGTFAYSPSL